MNVTIEEQKENGFVVKVTSIKQKQIFAKYTLNKPLEINYIEYAIS